MCTSYTLGSKCGKCSIYQLREFWPRGWRGWQQSFRVCSAFNTMAAAPSPRDIECYYRAALLGLRVLDAQRDGALRFSPDADSRWSTFRGDLHDADRVDLLLRDAAMASPAGFSPRLIFDQRGLPPDEPFGPDWPGPPAPLAAALLLHSPSSELIQDLPAFLTEVCRLWDLHPAAPDPEPLQAFGPATRVAVAGAGAVMALAQRCVARRDLDLADQALLCADEPGVRHLFGLALAWLRAPGAAQLLPPLTTAPPPHLMLVSSDASPASQQRAQSLMS